MSKAERKFIATVVVPAFGRSSLLNRLVSSILNSNGSSQVQIIIIDDCSPVPIKVSNLREQDKLIRLNKNSGAPVARNVGIRNSEGSLIYLMDSDDYIVERDFISDFKKYNDTEFLYYSSILSQGFKSKYPDNVTLSDFFDCIFFKHPHICQTSSLFFSHKLDISFDETLPKHQDWDLLYFSVLLNGIELKKGDGTTYFDRRDRTSLSRASDGRKSLPWYNKILAKTPKISNKKQLQFHLFSQYLNYYNWKDFIYISCKLLINNKTSWKFVAFKFVHRLKSNLQLIFKFSH